MTRFAFPKPYSHDHPPIQNVNELLDQQATMGQRTADMFARVMGSWAFLIIQTILLAVWVSMNLAAWILHWDPYPFILLNLFLSMQAAYAAPVILMSQNRLAARDRLEAHHDFVVNQKAEEEVRTILTHLDTQNQALQAIHDMLAKLSPPEASGSCTTSH